MREYDLSYMLDIIGKLKDSEKEDSAANRFRKHLSNKVNNIEAIRPYVNECLEKGGTQFNRALQDIVNHIGELLEFEVEYGRYKGKQGVPGHDGLWESQEEQNIIVETKTTNAYTIKTSQILNYRNELVENGRIEKDKSLGLYVVGRKDMDENQLENAIVAESREKELRTMSIDALLDLLEVKQRYDVDHETILSILMPAGASVDPYINLISGLIEQEEEEKEALKEGKKGITEGEEKEVEDEEIIEIDPDKPIKYDGEQSMAFTKIDQAVFAEYEGMKSWRDIARKAIQKALDEGKSDFVRKKVKIVEDLTGEDFSLRATGATEACRYIIQLAKELGVNLGIRFHWRNKENAPYPGKKGIIRLN